MHFSWYFYRLFDQKKIFRIVLIDSTPSEFNPFRFFSLSFWCFGSSAAQRWDEINTRKYWTNIGTKRSLCGMSLGWSRHWWNCSRFRIRLSMGWRGAAINLKTSRCQVNAHKRKCTTKLRLSMSQDMGSQCVHHKMYTLRLRYLEAPVPSYFFLCTNFGIIWNVQLDVIKNSKSAVVM